MSSITDVRLRDILPSALAGDANALAMADAAEAALKNQLLARLRYSYTYTQIAKKTIEDERLLDALAWALHIDFYDSSAPIARKRDIVAVALETHYLMGTKSAVEKFCAAQLGGSAVITEWFEYDGSHHHFRIRTETPIQTSAEKARFLAMLNTVKRESAWLEYIEILTAAAIMPRVALGAHILRQWEITERGGQFVTED